MTERGSPKNFEVESMSGNMPFDNGAFNVNLDITGFNSLLEQKGADKNLLKEVAELLMKFQKDVKTEKAKGVALGSTMPKDAILSTSGIFSLLETKGIEVDANELEPYVSDA